MSEKAKIDGAQDRLSKWRNPVDALLANDPEAGYADLYLEATTGQVYVAAVNVEYTRRQLATLPGALNDIVIVPADFTTKQLDEADLKMAASILDSKGAIINTGIDVKANSLIVGVASENRAGYPAAVMEIASQVATRFEVVPLDKRPRPMGTNQQVSPPVRGGTIIKNAWQTNCTLGFVGYRNNGLHALTAGHCGLGPYYQGLTTTGYSLGYVTEAQRCFSAATCGWDFMWIPLASGTPVSRHIHESTTALRSMTSWQLKNEDGIDQKVCMSGYNRNYAVCGTIKNKALHENYGNGWMQYYLREATYTGVTALYTAS